MTRGVTDSVTAQQDVVTRENAAALAATFAGYWWAPLAVFLAYTPASFIMFPLSALLLVGLVNALIYLARAITARRQQYRQQSPYYQ